MTDTKYYFDFHFPLDIVRYILRQLFGRDKPTDPGAREWFSQPRPSSDKTPEVVTVIFKLPLSVSEVTVDVLRVPCILEVYYLDRQNNWRPVMDLQRIPLRVNVSGSDAKSWYKFNSKVYPVVAKQVQLRLTRTPDPTLENVPYVCGLRNTLIRRNVYDRGQGTTFFEAEEDTLGNTVTKYIKDWDTNRAFDNDPATFWRSAPQPDPLAVVSLYLDVRREDGGPSLVDKVYIDPVYTDQMLNIYYSSDDIVGTRKLSPITARPTDDLNTAWRVGRGRTDIAPGLADAYYRWNMAIGPLVRQDAWLGVEWIPDFDPASGPPQNPILLRAVNTAAAQAYKPFIEYDVGAAEFLLQFSNGIDTRTYTAPMTRMFVPGEPIHIVAGWSYDPDMIHIAVHTRLGEEIAVLHEDPTNLPELVSFDGAWEFFNFKGTMVAHVIKLEYFDNSAAFMANPTYYCNPDPVIPDAQGNIPSSSLDNAVYAAAWIAQEHGTGGGHESAYDDKEWTPVWRDYIVQKGMMFLPQSISMKYMKLEFTNLSEEPYPVYESGIETKYKIFPTSVAKQASLWSRLYSGETGFLGMSSFIAPQGPPSVNWLSPQSVQAAIGTGYAPASSPVVVTHGTPVISDTIPNQGSIPVGDSNRVEMASPYVFKRDSMNTRIMAFFGYTSESSTDNLQGLESLSDVTPDDVRSSAVSTDTRVQGTSGTLPMRGSDWWVFPGEQLRLPASVMTKLTDTQTAIERKLTRQHRTRFNLTSIHRYEWKTVRRDAAIAYFAGVREVIPMTNTYINGEDKPYFDFAQYDDSQWVMTDIRAVETGPVTAKGRVYRVSNPSFDRSLTNWITNGNWEQDKMYGHYARGSARTTGDGNAKDIQSTKLNVIEGDEIDFTVWVAWKNLEATDNEAAMRLGGVTYLDGVEVERLDFAQISYADWTAHTDSGDFVELKGTWLVPAGIDQMRIKLDVTEDAHAGNIWFDLVAAEDGAFTSGTLFKDFETRSSFAKVLVDFRDSGLIRSDSMWADINPDSESIDDTALAYYVDTIPSVVPGGMWGDTIKAWGSDVAEWGTPQAIVSITIDGFRRYQGKRVLHFHRAPLAGEAGIKIKQFTNWTPLALFRIGTVFYKPLPNDNQITLRLRRNSDGIFIHEETITPTVGRWVEYHTAFLETPDTDDQEYTVSITLDGDDEDELYLSDLFCEIAPIRYFLRLGGVGSYLHEVSDLRYIKGYAQLSTTTPVTQMSMSAAIMSPEAWCFGCRLTPTYLR